MELKNIVNFLFELGKMRYIARSGWSIIGVRDPDNISEHSLRTAQVAFALAVLEGHEDPYRVCAMGVFHEIGEVRVGDQNKINSRYVNADETKAVKDQTLPLGEIGERIMELWQECEDSKTHTGMIAKDADRLELMITAKEYMESGYPEARDWFDRASQRLQTESAKKLSSELEKMSSNDWWRGLKMPVVAEKK